LSFNSGIFLLGTDNIVDYTDEHLKWDKPLQGTVVVCLSIDFSVQPLKGVNCFAITLHLNIYIFYTIEQYNGVKIAMYITYLVNV